MAPIAIDIGIAETLQAINGILARRDSERASMWSSLAYQLEAVSFAVGDLDRMYFAILAEIENAFTEPKPPSVEAVEGIIGQATVYCTDGRLALRLNEWRGAIESAAFSRALDNRRYRTLASVLRSINDPLGRYIQRLNYLQGGSGVDVCGPADQEQAGGARESFLGDRMWDLGAVLELVKSTAFRLPESEFVDGAARVRAACEQAIRNYDRALSLALVHLIGHARQDLAMERL